MVIDWQVGGELEVGQGTPARQPKGPGIGSFHFPHSWPPAAHQVITAECDRRPGRSSSEPLG